MREFFDTAEPDDGSPEAPSPVLPSTNGKASALRIMHLSMLNSSARLPRCRRFTARLATSRARLAEPRGVACSFAVEDLHLLPKHQLAWRTPLHAEPAHARADGDVRRTFPTVERILEAGEEGLEKLELGLDKHRKIVAAARQVSRGELDLPHLSQPQVRHAKARMRLNGCYGIGPKIADCIALFALDKMDAFPVDGWVRRAMEDRYFPDGVSSDETLVMWARDRFGEHAGYANQLLFHAQRDADNRARRVRRRTPAARCE